MSFIIIQQRTTAFDRGCRYLPSVPNRLVMAAEIGIVIIDNNQHGRLSQNIDGNAVKISERLSRRHFIGGDACNGNNVDGRRRAHINHQLHRDGDNDINGFAVPARIGG